jgi:hypothetical protein
MNDDITQRLDAMIREERQKEVAAGTGAAARRARYKARRNNNKNECPAGHLYTKDNTLYNAAGRRICLTCHAERRIYKDRLADRKQRRGGKDVIDLS